MSPLMYLTPWFMALFTSLPCWDAVLTIWDLLLLDGKLCKRSLIECSCGATGLDREKRRVFSICQTGQSVNRTDHFEGMMLQNLEK